MSASKPTLVFLRNFLTDKPGQTTNAVKSWAFSPDIIPQFGSTVSESQLTSSYANFISFPLMSYENNNIYVRGITTSNAKTTDSTFTMMAVPSELILWPQVWNKTAAIGPGPLIVDGESANELVAAQAPFTFRPSNLGGFNYSLISVQSATPPTAESTAPNARLRDALPSLPASVGNWRDYYKFLTTDQTTTYTSVIVADPTSPLISISTRLRMFENDSSQGPAKVQLLIEHAGIPSNAQVSISSDNGGINLARTSIGSGSGDVGVHVQLANDFDTTLTLNIYPPENSVIDDYSWIALQASTLSTDGDGISTECLLGSQNVVFVADVTRNARFASPAPVAGAAGSNSVTGPLGTGEDTGTPAVGWWFRDSIGDINAYPRDGVMSHSPDIQVLGTAQDSNAVADLGGANSNTDVTDMKGINIVGGGPNYINLRGNCTLGQNQVQSRLFALPSNVLITPSQYASNWSVNDYDPHGNATGYAKREITTINDNDFNVFGDPFNFSNPAPPSKYDSDHYCLVAETRHPTSSNPDPNWPHEVTANFSTGADFNTWIAGTSTVAWRNIGYITDHGATSHVYTTSVTIPADMYPPSTTWLLVITGNNAPVGSSWALTSSGDSIPGVTIEFSKTEIISNIMTQGVHFTGLPSAGYNLQLKLQWWSNRKKIPYGQRMVFQYELIAVSSTPAPPLSLAKPLPISAKDWPFHVGSHHPGLPKHKNSKGRHPLVPLYDHVGEHKHPHATHHAKYGVHKQRSLKNGKLGDGVTPAVGYKVGGDTFVMIAA